MHLSVRGRTLLAAFLAAAFATTALAANPEEKPILRAGPIPVGQWLKASTSPLTSSELDQLIAREQRAAHVKPAPRTTDEQFVRRVYLDVTGRLPLPADVTEFVANPDPKKRSNLIDKLLDSDEYAQHWAAYWRQVIGIRLTSAQGRGLQRNFERWLAKQFKDNPGWHTIAREMLTYQGPAKFDDEKAGPAFFLGSHLGADSVVEQAAETSRVLMGVQINCAQCHDHPFDAWKREQFHQLAAYFARIRPRPLREERRLVGIDMTSGPRQAEHRIPDKNNPRTGTPVNPRFLDGTAPGKGLSDRERRVSLADSITSKNNPWFAAAFVNRIWGELLGQSFYSPIDDLGPQKEAVFGAVLIRVAGAFRGSDYNVKNLYRVILNSETYQRQSRGGESSGDHLQFAASYPTRLKADALWESLQHVLGKMSAPGGAGPRRGPLGFAGGLEGVFKQEFGFDPSLKADDVEGSIPQALLLMNSPAVQQRIKATGNNLLGRILSSHAEDGAALDMVYLRTLARKPTDREKAKCLAHVKKVANRPEAFEDVLWALLNSTEFQTRR